MKKAMKLAGLAVLVALAIPGAWIVVTMFRFWLVMR